jgi:hypothetical protein
MKLTRKTVKGLKRTLIVGALNQINSEAGLVFQEWDIEYREGVEFHVDSKSSFKVGFATCAYVYYARVSLASELAKRQLRDMFPEQAKFITWAWYN